MEHPHNFGSALRMFLKFCTMKATNSYMEVILMVFLKNSHLGQMEHFGPENDAPENFGSTLRIFFEILHNEL